MGQSIVISILANANQANSTLDATLTRTQKVGNGFRKLAGPAAIAFGALAAGAGKAATAAAEDAKSQTILATALQRSAKATDGQIASTEKFIDKTARAKGVADDQLRPALANLVRGSGDLTKAQKDLGLVLDISAATGKDVTAVSAALAKGYGGNTTALGRLVPGLDKGILASKDMSKITGELARVTGGTAAKAAETEAGKRARANIALDESVETIGGRLLPAYAKAATAGAAAANWLAKNEKAAYILAGTIAALATVVLAVNVGMKLVTASTALWTAATTISAGVQKAATAASLGTRLGLAALAVQTGITTAATLAGTAATKAAAAGQAVLNAVLAANPIGALILLIGLLVGGLIYAYKNSETFRKVVDAAFQAVSKVVTKVVGFVVNFVRNNWKLLVAILTGPIGIAVLLISKHWASITAGVAKMVSAVKTKFGEAVAFVRGIPGKILGALGNVGNMLRNAGRSIITGLISGISDKIGALKSKITSITNLIPKLKGPLSYDKVMLEPAGKAIMNGLINGIAARETALRSKLRSITATVARTDFATAAVSAASAGAVAVTGATAGVVQYITVKVEVPLRASASEVGREIVEALREYAGTGGSVKIV